MVCSLFDTKSSSELIDAAFIYPLRLIFNDGLVKKNMKVTFKKLCLTIDVRKMAAFFYSNLDILQSRLMRRNIKQ